MTVQKILVSWEESPSVVTPEQRSQVLFVFLFYDWKFCAAGSYVKNPF